MPKYYLRIIADSCSTITEKALNQYLHSLPMVSRIHTEPLKSYWKIPEHGEMNCSFISGQSIEEIQAVLADHWEGDNADARWSHIHVPYASFIWLSVQCEINL